MRNGLFRLGQALGDNFAHAVVGHDLVIVRFIEREDLIVGHGRRELGLRHGQGLSATLRLLRTCAAGCDELVDIALDDAPMRSAAADLAKVKAGFNGEAAGERRNDDAFTGLSARRWRRTAGSWDRCLGGVIV